MKKSLKDDVASQARLLLMFANAVLCLVVNCWLLKLGIIPARYEIVSWILFGLYIIAIFPKDMRAALLKNARAAALRALSK